MEGKAASVKVSHSVSIGMRPVTLGTTDDAVLADRGLYQKNCEACHGYDGQGKTVAGEGMSRR